MGTSERVSLDTPAGDEAGCHKPCLAALDTVRIKASASDIAWSAPVGAAAGDSAHGAV